MGLPPSEFWDLTIAEAQLLVHGYQQRLETTEKLFRKLAVIAACGPYTEEGIESLLSDGAKKKPKRSREEEAALVLKKYKKQNREG